MELEPRVFWIVVTLGLALIAYLAWLAHIRKGRDVNSDETGKRSAVCAACSKKESPAVNEKDDLPEAPNSFDPAMSELIRANQERLRLDRERVLELQRERARAIVKIVLQKYEEMLPTAKKMPFPIDVQDYLFDEDLYVARHMLAKKGWKMTFTKFSNGVRFELSPNQTATVRSSARAET